jgi:hypothetical protein
MVQKFEYIFNYLLNCLGRQGYEKDAHIEK